MRVLVCGSRTFEDHMILGAFLSGLRMALGDFTVVEGECPFGGADILAREWAESRGLLVEPHPPKRETSGHFLARDREMVDSGVDFCVAFVDKPLDRSRGTVYTVAYARTKDVPTVVVEV
jgi:hypothetical protein